MAWGFAADFTANVSKFLRGTKDVGDSLEDVADSLDDIARDGDKAGEKLERSFRDAADATQDLGDEGDDTRRRLGRTFDDVQDDAKKTGRAVENLARDFKSASKKVDDSTDRMGDSVRDVRDEANDTAREMAASFDGSADSAVDAFQELGANAGQAFGPVGIAAGAAAAVGVGLIRAEAEKIKELASEMVEEMIEAGGRLSESFIDAKVQEMAQDGTLNDLADQAAFLNLNLRDLVRAKAGDGEAAARLQQRLADLSTEITDNAAAAGSASGEMYAQQTAINQLSGEIGDSVEAYKIATRASQAYADVTGQTSTRVQGSARVSGGAWDDLRSNMEKGIRAPIKVDAPSSRDLQIQRLKAQAYFDRNPVTIRTKLPNGKRPIRDVP